MHRQNTHTRRIGALSPPCPTLGALLRCLALAVAFALTAIAAAACSAAPTPTPTPALAPTPTAADVEPGTPDPTPTPKIIASLAAPVGVAVAAADRRLAVSWSPVAGATGYKVAARLENTAAPFEWTEYEAAASPYVVTDNWAAMSGLRYEVRTASVNAVGRSEWSSPVLVTAPELPLAPADAITLQNAAAARNRKGGGSSYS